ncbi:competence type IV pilus ATPase ComGA [Liquorilactobacillus satsumensis]|uniref:competence type IV pilus ATPase ComGA n=1 Tax=Liquorilactobacillus satsumensis TaxID=259059 RepID=UPI0009E835D7|nr:competence type IV pilus ATPase ComGA [Liquorilactobacillus satsumensis]MCC7667393.1 competence protein ComG [Liquorilactobacillus satsumensis]MCP9313252.1 Flp pilus assembly complex ATPase component TadA [Liquorilactobacillus satsumensis]MCP9329504.1 Flp pilus assembly complex ATPase component TadA [Liquorilactobacillus satsumensis]MCP9358609.1 Flp pilus assembly complex ATPase component TadA [Liquorilactobacillus satsumensis]MCP9360387.1 Flp pilus assembly complex ATPase component TadA [L
MSVEKLSDLLAVSLKKEASDIFLLPEANHYVIKLSIAGRIHFFERIEQALGTQIINNLKYQANMMLSEHRRPQTGALLIATHVYGRISSVGDFTGRESLVLRLIYEKKIAGRYFFPEQYQKIVTGVQKKGLILLAGPVGAGKTSTMYHVARQLQQQVMCIEDPVEIYEPAFLQLQVNERAQMTYARLIKAALRHRPDLFIIGEIRDEETATNVINAALSGHSVISTVHAVNVYGVIRRLLALGVNLEDLAQTLKLVCYQRMLPVVTGGNKVLFDQFPFSISEFIEHNGSQEMTEKWREDLEECLAKKWITRQTFQRYVEG